MPIPSKGIKREYNIVLDETAEHGEEPRSFQVVSTDHPRDRLPPNISHSAVKPVCEITIDLAKLKITSRQQRSLSGGIVGLSNKLLTKAPLKKRANPIAGAGAGAATGSKETSFDLFLLIGAADLRFEIKPRGEPDILASSEHDQIDVVWAEDDSAMARTSTAVSRRTDDLILKKS